LRPPMLEPCRCASLGKVKSSRSFKTPAGARAGKTTAAGSGAEVSATGSGAGSGCGDGLVRIRVAFLHINCFGDIRDIQARFDHAFDDKRTGFADLFAPRLQSIPH
jgi:hypothetical protein